MSVEPEFKKQLLQLCDKVRDHDLTNLGVYLDDRDSGKPALVKFIPMEELIAAREAKLAKEVEKEKKKEAARLERERIEKEKAEKGKLSHLDMFRTPKYTEWDADGMPLKDEKGEEVTKSQSKKLRKDWERQKKLHEAWLAQNDGVST
jgi:cysteinyl-tRNA synthetase